VLHALDPDEDLVQMPFVAGLRPAAAQTVGEALAELLAPPPYRLIGDHDAPLSQEQLDIPEAEAERMIQPHCVADDLRGEAVAVVRVRWRLHAVSLDPGLPGHQPQLP